ncbi:MAG: hypothetical protein COS89_09765, partial [Deltaproteobacteria bacterium CG07_land_8_20_14_0_80_38_7]
LKNTGSIYVHCDWHASHYIKCEMDKVFGFDNFLSEVIWCYRERGISKTYWNRKHDIILFYAKAEGHHKFNCGDVLENYSEEYKKKFKYKDEIGLYQIRGKNIKGSPVQRADGLTPETEKLYPELTYRQYMQEGMLPTDWWELPLLNKSAKERMEYPTQKPEVLLERIIKASSNEGDIIADFFMGGGTTCAVAQKLNRKFIGCDISRVASSVALNRLIRDAEHISGRTASVNIGKPTKDKQAILELTLKNIPDMRVYYMGVYPIEKFECISQKEFEDFILTSYEARRFIGEGEITGVMNSATSILVGSVKPHESISEERIKKFVEDVLKLRYQDNIRLKLKVIAWVFPQSLQKYARILENYFSKKCLPVEIELIPINSQRFRDRILEHYQDASKNEFLLKFISQASVMDITYKKVDGLKYRFEAVGARSNNIDGHLINCQWDFNFIEGRFADSEYAL